ncbi:MAG TPA: hypothetical protein VN837_06730 [Chloroflexota bacterium]|nr:hypothetical protein [Chloroflexota bacterium]
MDQLAHRLRGAWRVAAGRRSLLCGLLAGCIVALLAEWAHGTSWLGPLAALVVASGVVLWSFRAVPRNDAAARFLDHALGLKEQLATALELETVPSQANSFLGAELRRSATTTARAIVATRSVRARIAVWEWGAVLVLLLVMVLIAAAPFGGSGGARTATGSSPGTVAGGTAPVLPVGPANPKDLSVRVAVVSAPSVNVAPAKPSGAGASSKPRAAVVRRVTVGQPGTRGRTVGKAGSSQHTSGGKSVSGKAANGNSSHTIPLVQGSKTFLPTTPSAKGAKGGTFSGTQPKAGAGQNGGAGSAGGALSRKSGSSSTAKGKGSASSNQGSAGQNAGAPGKNAPATSSAGSCALLYVCSRLTPSQLTAPGLVTGKGGFSGKGAPGGQTAGHARAASPTLGNAKSASPIGKSKQLAISSAYGSNKGGSRSTQQVAGHNGAGSSGQTTVTASPDTGQTVDYVPPDANLTQPGEDTIVSRYFTSHSSS